MVGRQYGGYVQSGKGAFPVFRGSRMQRGYGIGSLLSGMFRAAVPLLRKGAQALGKQALRTGIQVGRDVLSGQMVGDSVKRQVTQGAKKMVNRAATNRGTTTNKGSERGRRKKGIKRRASSKPVITSRAKRAKRSPPDIFD